jgi:deazaflavin-dependent oxidoreductase (nitroreductase family)
MNVRLTTTGRRSGEPREIPLYGWADGDGRIVIVGSRGGSAIDPAWAHNLRADPHALLHIGHETRKVVAREAEGEEHDRLWKLVCAEFPLYARYQQRTKRRIPLFALEPDTVD